MEAFLSLFSDSIRDLYGFMNPNENIGDFKIVPLQKEDELVGITIEFKFFASQVSPPTKYLSESHLNCLGIAFFLASVSAFNKQNKFFVLDDVISSFDSTHRKRFADLLNERFSSYQVIVLTHERTWFEYFANLVKGKGWRIATVKWTDSKGTYH